MKMISWNINGIQAQLNRELLAFIEREDADIYCFQETKASYDKIATLKLEGRGPYKTASLFSDDFQDNHLRHYYSYWAFAEKKGYSGVVMYTKHEPISVLVGIGDADIDQEGRVVTLEYSDYFVVGVYVPSANRELTRLPFRVRFDGLFLAFCQKLRKKKPVFITGDLNVAHEEIDLYNFKTNRGNPGFTDEERTGFRNLLAQGYIDTFREFVTEGGHYSWWGYFNDLRARDIGWRIDYWLAASELKNRIKKSYILKHVMGSDHCPVVLEIE